MRTYLRKSTKAFHCGDCTRCRRSRSRIHSTQNTTQHDTTQRQRQFVSPHSTLAILSLATNTTKAHSLSACRVKEVICREYARVLVEAQVNARLRDVVAQKDFEKVRDELDKHITIITTT
jgi:hypothetical protein